MPVLNLNEDERNTVIAALHHERVRLAGEWSKAYDDEEGSGFHRDSELESLAAAIDLTTDLRRKIEVAVDITKAAWHNEYGWLHPVKYLEAAKDAVEAGEITREEVADALGFDLAEVGAENVRDRMRQSLMSPGTWTTLPDDFGVDDLMFDITDPEEDQIVIASADTQTDGTVVGVYSFDLKPGLQSEHPVDKSVNKGIWAIITRNFFDVSDREIQLAEQVLNSDPNLLNAIKSSVEGLRKQYGSDRPQAKGWTTIPEDFEITYAEPTAFPYWNDMANQSDGLIHRQDGYVLAVCRIRHSRDGFKLGFTKPFRELFGGGFQKFYLDLDSAKAAAEDIFSRRLAKCGLALAS